MRRHGLMGIAQPLAKIQGADQRRDTRGDVNDRAAGKIEGREPAAQRCIQQAPFSPNHVGRSEEHTSELQSRVDLVCRLLLEKKKKKNKNNRKKKNVKN